MKIHNILVLLSYSQLYSYILLLSYFDLLFRVQMNKVLNLNELQIFQHLSLQKTIIENSTIHSNLLSIVLIPEI